MIGLMSLWTGTDRFAPSREALMLQTLAAHRLRKFFPFTKLVTDCRGAVIADLFGWPYDAITLHLEAVPKELNRIWTAGKIVAQLAETEAYCHVDNDFVLHSFPPADFLRARVFVQSYDEPAYYERPSMRAFYHLAGIPRHVLPYNTGIVGGTDLPLLHEYCRESIAAMDRCKHEKNGTVVAILTEQALLGDFLMRKKVKPEMLIPLPLSARPHHFIRCEFTHLWAWTKKEQPWVSRVEEVLAIEYPDAHRRFLENMPILGDVTSNRGGLFGGEGYY